MAALYLHQALFASDIPPQPSIVHRIGSPHEQQLSSISTGTLRTTTTDHSHPSEPLLHTPYTESSVYLDLLSRQPLHPDEAARTSWVPTLSLESDPMTPRERRRLREEVKRKRIRRLKWVKNILVGIAAAWAVYNAVRYLVAFANNSSRTVQTYLLVLGTASSASLALIIFSQLLRLSKLGWSRKSSLYTRLRTFLEWTSSILLLGPAVVNVVLVVAWKHSTDLSRSVSDRCSWDIDVLWSSTDHQSNSGCAVPWGFWIAGAVIRLAVTTLILLASHVVSYKYDSIRWSPRPQRSRTHAHSFAYPSAPVTEVSHFTHSHRSSRTMVSSTTAPVSIARIVRQSSNHTSESEGTAGRTSSSTTRPILRHGHPSSGGSEEASSDGLKASRQSFSQYSQPSSDGHIASPHRFASDDDRADSDSSEEDVTSDGHGGASSRYGRQIRHSPGAYSMVPPSTRDSVYAAETPLSFSPDGNMHNFVDRFRVLLDEVSRETDAALEFARNDRPGLYIDPTASSSPTSLDQISLPPSPDIDYVPIVGALIRRMPTIESLGSREVMSLASSIIRGDRSVHTISRPPTRANTLSFSEAAGSQPPSRSNSLTASIVLASPIDRQSPPHEPGERS